MTSEKTAADSFNRLEEARSIARIGVSRRALSTNGFITPGDIARRAPISGSARNSMLVTAIPGPRLTYHARRVRGPRNFCTCTHKDSEARERTAPRKLPLCGADIESSQTCS